MAFPVDALCHAIHGLPVAMKDTSKQRNFPEKRIERRSRKMEAIGISEEAKAFGQKIRLNVDGFAKLLKAFPEEEPKRGASHDECVQNYKSLVRRVRWLPLESSIV